MNTRSIHRQRIDSSARIVAKRRGEQCVVASLDQRGGAKIRLPRSTNDTLDTVLVNTAGGLTDNDQIDWQCEAESGARLRVTTGACEKIYRSSGASACQATRIAIGDDARVLWLPQETIVYDQANLVRTLDVSIEGSGEFIACESLVFGRKAMGETVRDARISDNWRVYRDQELVHAEAVQIDAQQDLLGGNDAAFGCDVAYIAMSTVVFCIPEDPQRLDRLARRLNALVAPTAHDKQAACHGGVSVLPGRLSLRLLATDAYALRARLVPALQCLAAPDGLPRIWHT